MPSIRRCFLCNYKYDPRNAHIMMHSFPSCEDVKKQWIKVCNMLPTDNVANLFICSKHFQPEDYYKPHSLSTKYKLNLGAVPSRKAINTVGIGFKGSFDLSSTSCDESVTEVEVHAEVEKTTANLASTSSVLAEDTLDVINEDAVSINLDAGQSTPRKRRFAEPRYINEISPTHVKTPRRAKRVIDMVKRNYKNQAIKIKQLQDANRLLHKRVKTLEDMVGHLKQKNLLSEQAGDKMLQLLPESIQEMMKKQLRGNKKYSEKLRSFALTLHFYSPRAYLYVRSVWKNLLPHTSTIKQWYRVINAAPGFTAEALNAIKIKAAEKKTFINICIDEMSIKEQMVYNNNRFYGAIEFGAVDSFDIEEVPMAKYALVFMAVPINDNWKIPVGYFLISGLSGKERSMLLIQCIELINETGALVHSITFDGAPSNISMCTELGACYNIDNLKPYFKIPNSPTNIYTFFDICHMIKLVRNTFGDKKCLKYENKLIKWEYIEDLVDLQNKEGLRLANKLTKKHVLFNNHRMNVRIACQTLSTSVSKSLLFLKESTYDSFKNAEATADFCKMFNDVMDVLNCKNAFSKTGYNIPLNEENFMILETFAKSAEEYIKKLTENNGCPILKSPRKIGFLGIIVDLNIIFRLYQDLSNLGLQYLLTYKVNQDYLETFFSAIRARGGFNDNPNSLQFQSAYKRLLLRMELKHIETGNCLFDGIDILHVSSKHVKQTIDVDEVEEDVDEMEEACIIQSHDYLGTAWTLTPFVNTVVSYMAGYVVYKILKTLRCEECIKCLLSKDKYDFIELKKYSDNFVIPTKDVVTICKEAEKLLRQMSNKFKFKNTAMYISNKILHNVQVQAVFSHCSMIEHIKSQNILDNHRILLIKKIIDIFVNCRLHWETKKASEKKEYVRQKLHKLILFKNQ